MYLNPKSKNRFTELSYGGDSKIRAQVKFHANAAAGAFVPIIMNQEGWTTAAANTILAGTVYMLGFVERAYLLGEVGVVVVGGQVPDHPTIASLAAGNHFGYNHAGALAREANTTAPRKNIFAAKCVSTDPKSTYLYPELTVSPDAP